MRDAVPVPDWPVGQRVTVFDVNLDKNVLAEKQPPPKMWISTGEVVGHNTVPPSGGCVVSINLKLDGEPELLSYPGFHQQFVYGDFKRELTEYCRLHKIDPVIV